MSFCRYVFGMICFSAHDNTIRWLCCIGCFATYKQLASCHLLRRRRWRLLLRLACSFFAARCFDPFISIPFQVFSYLLLPPPGLPCLVYLDTLVFACLRVCVCRPCNVATAVACSTHAHAHSRTGSRATTFRSSGTLWESSSSTTLRWPTSRRRPRRWDSASGGSVKSGLSTLAGPTPAPAPGCTGRQGSSGEMR